MMDRDQRLIHGQSRSLGKVHTNQHRTNEARSISHRHRIDIIPAQSRLGQRLVRQAVNGLDMLAGCDLRHHAAVDLMQVHLGSDAVAKHFPSIPDDGYCSLIAGRFNSQNNHASFSFIIIHIGAAGV